MIAEDNAIEKAVNIVKRYRDVVIDAQRFVANNPVPILGAGDNITWIMEWLKNNALEDLLLEPTKGRIE